MELEEVYARLQRADRPVREQGATTCCYSQGEKSWIDDPQGVQWETFLATGESTVYGYDPLSAGEIEGAAPSRCGPSCCTPTG
jgi:hypothetical protein